MKKALTFITSRRFLLILTAIGMTATYIVFPSPFYLVLPLYISLFVNLLISKANRYCFLIGGLNSILYAITYISLGIYMSAFYAFFFSFTLQICTFFTWKKRSYKNSTTFRKMSPRLIALVSLSFVLVYFSAYFVMTLLGSSFVLLDTFTSLLGILVTVMHLFSFREAPFVQTFSTLIGFALQIALVMEDPSRWPVLISHIHSAICVWRSIPAVWRLYKEQQAQKCAETL